MTSFATTLYGQCYRRHVVRQQIVRDVSVVRVVEVFVICVTNQIIGLLICYYSLLIAVLKTSILLRIPNIGCSTTWWCVPW